MEQKFFAITNTEQLAEASAILHDGRFYANTIKYDSSTELFKMEVWITSEYPAGQQPTTWHSRTWKKCILNFCGVNKTSIFVKENVVYYEIFTFKFDPLDYKVEIICQYAIEIFIYVRSINGSIEFTNVIDDAWWKM